jgi:ATP-dependent helicase/nuclease subunit A
MQKNWSPTRLAGIRHGTGSSSAVARGRVIHKILQELPQMAPEEGLKFATRILAKNKLDWGLADSILSLIANPEYRDFFGAGSQAEVSISAMLPDGQRMTGKIDRLVIRPNDILFLDYKTDWNVPESLSYDHPYVLQVAAYAAALKQAYSDKTVKSAILWTTVPRVDWIADDTLQKAISNMAAIT